MLDGDRLTRCDSCARPDHPMINRLWVDRMPVCSVVIGQPTLVGRGIIGLTALIDRRKAKSLRASRTCSRDGNELNHDEDHRPFHSRPGTMLSLAPTPPCPVA